MGVLSRGLAEGCHWAGAPQRPTLPLLTSAGGACASSRGWGGPMHHLPSPFILSSARRPTLPPARAAGSLPPLQVTLVIWFPAGLKAAWLPSLAVLASVLAVQSRLQLLPAPMGPELLASPQPWVEGTGTQSQAAWVQVPAWLLTHYLPPSLPVPQAPLLAGVHPRAVGGA